MQRVWEQRDRQELSKNSRGPMEERRKHSRKITSGGKRESSWEKTCWGQSGLKGRGRKRQTWWFCPVRRVVNWLSQGQGISLIVSADSQLEAREVTQQVECSTFICEVQVQSWDSTYAEVGLVPSIPLTHKINDFQKIRKNMQNGDIIQRQHYRCACLKSQRL